jgi:REP element-mobilizing transposase RayT
MGGIGRVRTGRGGATTPECGLRGQSARRPRGSKRSCQLELAFPARWGGARAGAGRKGAERGNVPHRARSLQRAAEPVHVTMRARLCPLRSQHVFPTIRLALVRATRRDPTRFRILHFSVQRDHIHLVVEAVDKRALSSGMRSVAVRVARYVNDLLSRSGPVWADRWHGRALRTPREVRNALRYVLLNFRKHAHGRSAAGIDPFSSAAWFDGWRGFRSTSGVSPPLTMPSAPSTNPPELAVPPVGTARTWLARVGWRRHGLIGLCETPQSDASQSSVAAVARRSSAQQGTAVAALGVKQ